MTAFWFEFRGVPHNIVTDSGRYEVYRDISLSENHGAYTYTPVQAGPPTLCQDLAWKCTTTE